MLTVYNSAELSAINFNALPCDIVFSLTTHRTRIMKFTLCLYNRMLNEITLFRDLRADNFIGEAELSLLNENRVAEGRHILPLSGASDITYGSLTVEVL